MSNGNGNETLNELDLEKRMKGFTDRELIEFNVRQVYDMCSLCKVHTKQIAQLEQGNKKASGLVGGISGTITGIVVGVIDYLIRAK